MILLVVTEQSNEIIPHDALVCCEDGSRTRDLTAVVNEQITLSTVHAVRLLYWPVASGCQNFFLLSNI